MTDTILFALWFFLPAGLANTTPVFANRTPLLKQWKTPMDFGKSLGKKRLLGNNKTWRGFFFGILIAVITLLLQKYLYANSAWLQETIHLDYGEVTLWLGVLLGAGALLGDAIESAFKRQQNIPAGQSWFPFDQLDYIVGGLLLASLVVSVSFGQSMAIIIIWFAMHLFWTYVGFLLGLREQPI